MTCVSLPLSDLAFLVDSGLCPPGGGRPHANGVAPAQPGPWRGGGRGTDWFIRQVIGGKESATRTQLARSRVWPRPRGRARPGSCPAKALVSGGGAAGFSPGHLVGDKELSWRLFLKTEPRPGGCRGSLPLPFPALRSVCVSFWPCVSAGAACGEDVSQRERGGGGQSGRPGPAACMSVRAAPRVVLGSVPGQPLLRPRCEVSGWRLGPVVTATCLQHRLRWPPQHGGVKVVSGNPVGGPALGLSSAPSRDGHSLSWVPARSPSPMAGCGLVAGSGSQAPSLCLATGQARGGAAGWGAAPTQTCVHSSVPRALPRATNPKPCAPGHRTGVLGWRNKHRCVVASSDRRLRPRGLEPRV